MPFKNKLYNIMLKKNHYNVKKNKNKKVKQKKVILNNNVG